MTALALGAFVDGVASAVAQAIDGKVYAAATWDGPDGQRVVGPLVDDFTEKGVYPAVTAALGPWYPLLQPGNERMHADVVVTVWRPRQPLSESSKLYDDLGLVLDALIAHTKAFTADPRIQSAVVTGGPGVVPAFVPAAGGRVREFLTLPVRVEVVSNRTVLPQPA